MAVYLVNELLVCLWGVAFLVPHRWSPSVKIGRRLFVSVCFFQMFLLVAQKEQHRWVPSAAQELQRRSYQGLG